MTDPAPAPRYGLVALLASASLARAFTLATMGAVFGSFLIERLAGRVTLVTILGALCALGAGMLIARRDEFSIVHLAPTTLVVFLGWALVSITWSTDRGTTLAGWLSLAGIALLAVVVGHVRDPLQTVRALGDVLRWLLSISLGLEVLSGVLLDTPFAFLGIQGRLAELGPIQGAFGTRNLLGFVTVVALITFLVEYRTLSVRVGLAIFSVVLGGVMAMFSDSPTVLVVALAVALATAALIVVRNAPPERRTILQWVVGGVVVVGLVTGYALRATIIGVLGAGTDFSVRTDLWNVILTYVGFRPVQGWGWFGAWAPGEFPFIAVNLGLRSSHASALSAYFDALLQIGWLGLLLFLALGATALVRSWLVASERRSVVHAWTPLMLVALLVDSLFESFTLAGIGWFLLVLCAVRAGQSRSWRARLGSLRPPEVPDALPAAGETNRPSG